MTGIRAYPSTHNFPLLFSDQTCCPPTWRCEYKNNAAEKTEWLFGITFTAVDVCRCCSTTWLTLPFTHFVYGSSWSYLPQKRVSLQFHLWELNWTLFIDTFLHLTNCQSGYDIHLLLWTWFWISLINNYAQRSCNLRYNETASAEMSIWLTENSNLLFNYYSRIWISSR